MADGGGGMELGEKIAIGHGVHAVGTDLRKFQSQSDSGAIGGIWDTGQGSAAQGEHVHADGAIREAANVALQHFEVGQHVVSEQHRLRALQVRVARHQDFLVLPCQFDEGALHRPQTGNRVVNGGASVQAHIQGDLVVARATGVQARSGRTDQVGEPAFDVHVQVFQGRIPREVAPFDLVLHSGQAANYGIGIFPGDDALLRQHGRVGLGAGYVLPVQPAVVVYGDGVVAMVLHSFGDHL